MQAGDRVLFFAFPIWIFPGLRHARRRIRKVAVALEKRQNKRISLDLWPLFSAAGGSSQQVAIVTRNSMGKKLRKKKKKKKTTSSGKLTRD